MMKIAFIGVGVMGKAMVKNLSKRISCIYLYANKK
ncbi:MAG: NAD(P)-binding domain-containing protein [Thomasclavelia ramosa]